MTTKKERVFGVSISVRLMVPIVVCILLALGATSVFWVSKLSATV